MRIDIKDVGILNANAYRFAWQLKRVQIIVIFIRDLEIKAEKSV